MMIVSDSNPGFFVEMSQASWKIAFLKNGFNIHGGGGGHDTPIEL